MCKVKGKKYREQRRTIRRIREFAFAAGDAGLSTEQLTEVMEITHIEALNLLELLSDRYNGSADRGLILLELAGTFQLATKKAHAEFYVN